MLGSFYKLPLPLTARDQLEHSIGPAIVEAAEQAADAGGLALLLALVALDEDGISASARSAAERLVCSGMQDPPWASEIGHPEFIDAWMLEDVYGDQTAYFATFRYEGRDPHVVTAVYDENLGGIIKDAFAGYPKDPEEARRRAELEPGAAVSDADPGVMATKVIEAIHSGDLYLDNDWTPDFKEMRALLLQRMRLLPAATLQEPAPPNDERRRRSCPGPRVSCAPFAIVD